MSQDASALTEIKLAASAEEVSRAFDDDYKSQLYRLFLCYPNIDFSHFGDTAVEDVQGVARE